MTSLVLQSGREYVFAGDVACHMDGIRRIRGKDTPWINEDEAALATELKWLDMLDTTEKNLFVAISPHEEQWQYVERGVLGDGLE